MIKTTKVFWKNLKCVLHPSVYNKVKNNIALTEQDLEIMLNTETEHIINIGGTRSSKTYSICQVVLFLVTHKKLTIDIIKKSFTTLETGIMKTFLDILKDNNMYSKRNHIKTLNGLHQYRFANGSLIRFYSVASEQSLRGIERDITVTDESNELTQIEWQQIIQRTRMLTINSFNPSDRIHFLYDLMSEENVKVIHSTFLDNSFLPKKQINNILRNKDENYQIYVLGKRATSRQNIFNSLELIDTDLFNYKKRNLPYCYGIDWGFSHPCVVVKCYIHTKLREIFVEEILHKTGLTPDSLEKELKNINFQRTDLIYCDSAYPAYIQQYSKNLNVTFLPGLKNVKDGITKMKNYTFFFNENSKKSYEEMVNYKWKKKGDYITEEVEKLNDDSCDAIRYGVYNYLLKIESGNKFRFKKV